MSNDPPDCTFGPYECLRTSMELCTHCKVELDIESAPYASPICHFPYPNLLPSLVDIGEEAQSFIWCNGCRQRRGLGATHCGEQHDPRREDTEQEHERSELEYFHAPIRRVHPLPHRKCQVRDFLGRWIHSMRRVGYLDPFTPPRITRMPSPTTFAYAYSPVDSICEEPPDAAHAQDPMLTLLTNTNTPSSSWPYRFRPPSNLTYSLLSTHKQSNLVPSTPSGKLWTGLQIASSPGAVSPSTSLVYPDFSSPFQENTPFDRQFSADFSSSLYSQLTEYSPVSRKDSSNSSQSVSFSLVPSGEPSQNSDSSNCFSSQPVSLMERLLSVAPKNSTPSDDKYSHRPTSPCSAVSVLTPLSSPSGEGLYAPRTGTPPTSPSLHMDSSAPSTQAQECAQIEQGIDVCISPVESSQSVDIKPQRQPARKPKSGGRKRKRASSTPRAGTTTDGRSRAKRARTANQTETVLPTVEGDPPTRRQLPPGIQYHPQFSLFYRRFPASSYLESTDGMSVLSI